MFLELNMEYMRTSIDFSIKSVSQAAAKSLNTFLSCKSFITYDVWVKRVQ